MALHQPLAVKGMGDDDGVEMAAIAIHLQVGALQALGDVGANVLGGLQDVLRTDDWAAADQQDAHGMYGQTGCTQRTQPRQADTHTSRHASPPLLRAERYTARRLRQPEKAAAKAGYCSGPDRQIPAPSRPPLRRRHAPCRDFHADRRSAAIHRKRHTPHPALFLSTAGDTRDPASASRRPPAPPRPPARWPATATGRCRPARKRHSESHRPCRRTD